VSGQLHAPAALAPRKEIPLYIFDRRLGGRREEENLPLPGTSPELSAVQPVASRNA
jgi:hypothetical protein